MAFRAQCACLSRFAPCGVYLPTIGRMMDEFSEIRQVIEPSIENLGFEIVRLKWVAENKRKILQLMIEPKDGGIVTVENCEEISRTISAILDVEDIIADEYNLEVSSPGIDRPLTRLKDFDKFKNFEAKIETRLAINDQRRFRGKVIEVNGEEINFELKDNGEVVTIEFPNISEAKLVLTDELIKAGISN